ncbi:MAG: putative aminopeptidase FrvX [Verrucomicrobiales bacterium]|jgi:putative aminopeptidase FrvX
MDEKSLLTILRKILAQPTAPFHEYSVRNAISKLLGDQANIRLELDGVGNLFAYYEGTDSPPRWALGSHMDHPGWVKSLPTDTPGIPPIKTSRQRDGFTFLGGVPNRYFQTETPIREFGDFAMWDLIDFKLEKGLISSRACDDLIGCAAIVSTLLQLQRDKVATSCVGIFTRAEEVGFYGAIELAKNWPLDRECVFVSIETSLPPDSARMSNGPMCRVGDRMSIFNSDATATLLSVAEENQLPIQRALLDRGSCEATALQTYGIITAGMSVPLGNYHNCGDYGRIKPEYVALVDVKNLVTLLTAVTTTCPDGPRNASTELRERLEARALRYQAYAEASEQPPLA